MDILNFVKHEESSQTLCLKTSLSSISEKRARASLINSYYTQGGRGRGGDVFSVGIFEIVPSLSGDKWCLSNVQESILQKMSKLIENPAFVKNSLIPLITQELGVSLRVLDWLVTNYSKKMNLFIGDYNVHNGYKDTLSVYRRKHFDPFRRTLGKENHGRITFKYLGRVYETTVGQINFISWAFVRGILEYVKANVNEIEQDMNETTRARKKKKKAGVKRTALTTAPPYKCMILSV